jgi:hypothetical protein
MSTVQTNAFVIEITGIAAGLAVPERGGFRFYAADRRFAGLDGSRFGALDQIERAGRRFTKEER